MKPEDVPAELAEEVARGFLSRMEFGEPSPAEVRYMRASLAAVLPEYGAQVLEEFAAEVRSWAPYDTRDIGAAFPADGVSERIEEHIARLREGSQS